MTVNYHYSDELSSDPEGNLVALCRACATKHGAPYAAPGDSESECEVCDAANDPARSQALDEAVRAVR